ncbi:hypothetical protein [Paraburkholderia sp. SIMBA_054]|uniref:hypothetical protein n=1 Tax=Paraburkholderia sp. SIMBA_054 TaxID=3085795 RepID=UPI003978F167
MAATRASGKARSIPAANTGDGQAGPDADRGTDAAREAAGEDDWGAFSVHLLSVEQEHKHRRIVRVWHPDADAELWHGAFGCAPVEEGSHAYQFNNGEVVELSTDE